MKFPLPGNSGLTVATRRNRSKKSTKSTAAKTEENFVLESKLAHEKQCDMIAQYLSQTAAEVNLKVTFKTII